MWQELFGDWRCTTSLGAMLKSPSTHSNLISIRRGACIGVQYANVRVVIGQPSRHHSMIVQPPRAKAYFLALRFQYSKCDFLFDAQTREVCAKGSSQLLTRHRFSESPEEGAWWQ